MDANANAPARNGDSWFKAYRSRAVLELMKLSPDAFVVAYAIAFRAQWSDGFNQHGLKPGEAQLGDYENFRMTEQRYRTAKKILAKFGFAEFSSTRRGTIARLLDDRLFGVLNQKVEKSNVQNLEKSTDKPTDRVAQLKSVVAATSEAETTQANGQNNGQLAPQSNGQPTDSQRLPRRKEILEGNKGKVRVASQRAFVIPTEKEFVDYAIASGLALQSDEGCQAFWDSHQRDGWRTKRGRIRYWKEALHAFVVKFQDSQNGEYSPPPAPEHGRFVPTKQDAIGYCMDIGLNESEALKCWEHYNRNGWLVETEQDVWTRCDTGPGAWKFALDTWVDITIGQPELENRLAQSHPEKFSHQPKP